MHRRSFLTFLSTSAVVWPIVAQAQQRERVRRIGWLTSQTADDPVPQAYIAALLQGLQEFGLSGKWPELLKQVAPNVTRMAVLRDPTAGASMGQLGAIQGVVPSLRVEASPIDLRDPAEIERAICEFARAPNGGLVVLPSG